MTITYRGMESLDDLQLQYDFWDLITSELPYCWKATKSPDQFVKLTGIDTQSKCFAFDGDKLVGYISFSGEGDFVSMGYPWHLPGYEDMREELWKRVFGYASGDYGGKQFLQRFRGSWKEQIEFFQSKGFVKQSEYPLYILNLSEVENIDPPYDIKYSLDPFDPDLYFDLTQKNRELDDDHSFESTRKYYQGLQFDTSIQLYDNNELVGYVATTNRKDNGFCDILALSFPKDNEDVLSNLLKALIQNVEGFKHLSITIEPEKEFEIEVLRSLEFKNLDNEIYMGYSK